MSHTSLILILVSVTFSAVAQIAFKFGVSSDLGQDAQTLFGTLLRMLSPGILVGLLLYGIGAFLWLLALGRVELSQAYPFVGFGFVLTTLAGWYLFDDQISPQRLVGIALVIGGIVLVGKS